MEFVDKSHNTNNRVFIGENNKRIKIIITCQIPRQVIIINNIILND